ncbi:MAG: transglycosylase SLT domain-containing protein [Thiothrix litoralis]|uniref:transglycosylase SLT domain-containing protein n=1 Tax=Thiothrix litoralis TaxID=2891210 RepID=UPI003C71B3A1
MKKTDQTLLSALLAISLLCFPFSLYAGEAPIPACVDSSAKTLNKQAEPYQAAIKQAAKRYDVSPSLIKAVMASSSCFNAVKVSPQGAVGLMQLRADTAKRFGALEVLNPDANIDAGTRYLSYLLKRYQGSLAEVLTAYVSDGGRLREEATKKAPLAEIREPVKQLLSTLLKLANNKKANREAQALLKTWDKSEDIYLTALAALPRPDEKALKIWFKSRLASIHYARAPEARGCGGFSAKTLQEKAAPYEKMIQTSAKRYGVNPALVKSVIAAESCYREMVVSYKGASGLMQLMPETADELGVMDIFDPSENINGGTRYLSWLLKRYNGSFSHAIAAYNAGAGRVEQGQPITVSFVETRGYISKVLTNLTKLEKGKKSIENARLLLADWEQAELEYQAALRGETLAVAEPPAEPLVEGEQSPVEGQQQVASADANITTPLPAPMAEEQPGATLVFSRNEKVSLASAQAGEQPNFHLISMIDQDIVRVKRVSTTVIVPAAEPLLVETTLEAPVAVAGESVPAPQPVPQSPSPANKGLPSCDALPQSLLEQTEERGSGRYGAFFYLPQAGDTVEQLASRLGINPQDVLFLNNIQAGTVISARQHLKVAECLRNL